MKTDDKGVWSVIFLILILVIVSADYSYEYSKRKNLEEQMSAAFGEKYQALVDYGASELFKSAKSFLDDGEIRDFSGRLVMLHQDLLAEKGDWNSPEMQKKYALFVDELAEVIRHYIMSNSDFAQKEAYQEYCSLKILLEQLEDTKRRFLALENPAEAFPLLFALGYIEIKIEYLDQGTIQI